MTDFVKVVRASSLEINTGSQDLVVFRRNGTIELIAISDKSIPEADKDKELTFVVASKSEFESASFWNDEKPLELCIVGLRSDSGLVSKYYVHSDRTELKCSPLDSDWPNIFHVHTYGTDIVAIDGLPERAMQPIVFDRGSQQTPHAMQKIQEEMGFGQIFITASYPPRQHEVRIHGVEVYENGARISVPFVQRLPLVVMTGGVLVDWATWKKKERTHLDNSYTIKRIASEEELPPRGDWTSSRLDVYYTYSMLAGYRVWQWREMMCPDVEARDLFPTMVYDSIARKLFFGGFTRVYPLSNGGADARSWFYYDLVSERGIADKPILSVAHKRYTGCQNASMVANNTHSVVKTMNTDIDNVLKHTFTEMASL
jgi:hypothetical protein